MYLDSSWVIWNSHVLILLAIQWITPGPVKIIYSPLDYINVLNRDPLCRRLTIHKKHL